MANNVPLNVFKNTKLELTNVTQTLYTTPPGVTTIILMVNVSNVSGADAKVTFSHVDINFIVTEIVYDFSIPSHDSATLTNGKIILTEGESIEASADLNSALKIFVSILETSNE